MLHKLKMLTVLLLIVTGTLMVDAQATEELGATTLRVMTFNILYGGDEIDFSKVVEAVLAADADVVGVQEAEGNIPRLAEALGWPYYNTRMQIISKLPLIDPPGGDGIYIFVEAAPDQVVAMANVHLPSDPYGPYQVRDGASAEAVMALETELRLPALTPHLERLPQLVEAGIPVFLTGDFNAPSHLDWTAAVAEVRDEVVYPFEWPVTQAAFEVGFRDSYREAYPDPVARLGFTWTPLTAGMQGFEGEVEGEVHDRIDLVLVAGNAETVSSQLVGETDGPDVDIAVTPYPTDHRGVVSEFRVVPAPMPTLVATDQRVYRVGDTVRVRVSTDDPDAQIYISARAGNSGMVLVQALDDGYITLDTADLPADEHVITLLNGAGDEIARSSFWLLEPDAEPQLSVSQGAYASGEPIIVAWENAPANRWDWVGIFPAGDEEGNYLGYEYTRATVEGQLMLDADVTYMSEWPLPPGEYEVRLLLDDGYEVLASAPFTITTP